MLVWMFIVFLALAFLFMFTVIFKGENIGFFWNIVFILFSIILMYVLAVGIMDVETTYMFYNETGNYTVNMTHHYYSVENIAMSYFFYGWAVVIMVYFVAYVYTYIGKKKWLK